MNHNLIWKKGLPTEAGFYWFRNLDVPTIVKVRNYPGAGSMAVDNCILEGCKRYEDGEWAGPLSPPQEPPKIQSFFAGFTKIE